MARNKTITEKITAVKAKKEEYEKQMKELEQQKKEQDRRARTKRLCRRAGHLERILPETIALTDEQVDLFLDKTLLTEFSRRILSNIISGQLKPPEMPAETAQGNSGTDASKNEATARQAG